MGDIYSGEVDAMKTQRNYMGWLIVFALIALAVLCLALRWVPVESGW